MKVKQVPFPEEMIRHVDARRKDLGIGFPEYIRHLVLNDIERGSQISKQEEQNIESSLKDFAYGKYTKLKNKKEIQNHFDRVLKKENVSDISK